ncbi:MAG: hypothetical protein H6924_04505 [Alphaproteobacteria bacterium]|nr:hypothetical protein [Alphaproteobacteria bacterium]
MDSGKIRRPLRTACRYFARTPFITGISDRGHRPGKANNRLREKDGPKPVVAMTHDRRALLPAASRRYAVNQRADI